MNTWVAEPMSPDPLVAVVPDDVPGAPPEEFGHNTAGPDAEGAMDRVPGDGAVVLDVDPGPVARAATGAAAASPKYPPAAPTTSARPAAPMSARCRRRVVDANRPAKTPQSAGATGPPSAFAAMARRSRVSMS